MSYRWEQQQQQQQDLYGGGWEQQQQQDQYGGGWEQQHQHQQDQYGRGWDGNTSAWSGEGAQTNFYHYLDTTDFGQEQQQAGQSFEYSGAPSDTSPA
ncbi:hypothetical protein Pmani_010376 [Petrolisthes manimaculis]|uniref:Uncharacterized protein n=1 Tax=Petrolisthes manimaculis TaxID=1843537 RepID=A0AAE1Q388_9EUCA|nr:hypothetical protein Pmani_010376 [Petrolisthes manimaculis]